MSTRNRLQQAAAEVTPADSRRDVESMLELDPATLDENMTYRFVNKDSKTTITRRKMQGYRVVKVGDGPVPLVPFDDAGDGTIQIGDTILMACPKDMRKARQKATRQFSESRLKHTKTKVKRMAKAHRVRTVEDPEE